MDISTKEHPVLMIHKAPWCGACKSLLSPQNYNRILAVIRSVNPDTEIKVISHEDYQKTNKVENYPHVNYIQGFPSLMITTSSNCHKGGTYSKVHILDGKYDSKVPGGAILNINTRSDIEGWLRRYLDPKLYNVGKSTPSETNIGRAVSSVLTPSVKSKSKHKSFTLLPIND